MLAAFVALLVHDAPRAMDLAFVQYLAHRPTAAALLGDAMGLLSAFAPSPGAPAAQGLTLALGRPKGDGSTEAVPATELRLAPSGAVVAFAFGGHHFALPRDETGAVAHVHRDGSSVTLASLSAGRVPVTDGASWSDGGLVFARLQGSPRVGIAGGARVRVVGVGARGFDAAATPAPGDDVVVEGDLVVRGAPGGIVVRAITTSDAFKGVSLVVTPGAPARASLLLGDGTGNETVDAGPVDLPASASWHVKLGIKGDKVEGVVGGKSLAVTALPGLAHGDVALRAARGANVEVSGFSLRKQ